MSHKFPGTGVIGIVDTFCIIKFLLIRLLHIILLCTCQVVFTVQVLISFCSFSFRLQVTIIFSAIRQVFPSLE